MVAPGLIKIDGIITSGRYKLSIYMQGSRKYNRWFSFQLEAHPVVQKETRYDDFLYR
jgi:hypothetical protein